MKYLATICNEFVKLAAEWWRGETFRHPATRNRVKFKSLPTAEQKRLNALHRKQLKKEELRGKRKQRALDRKQRRLEKKKLRTQKAYEFKHMTPETHPNFFTETGIRLNTTHGMRDGIPIDKNPDWTPENDTAFYATQKNPKTGNTWYYYTENYMKKKGKAKFANVQRLAEILPSIREKYTAFMNSDDPRDRVYATAIALIDKHAMRIGNKKSEARDDVRGLHNLQMKHMKVDGNKVHIEYTGKDKVHQDHNFDIDDTIKRNLTELMAGKGPEDPIFTFDKHGKKLRISPRLTNRFFRRKLGSNVTVHKFRHYQGTKIADDFLRKINVNKITVPRVKLALKDAEVEVATHLGNTPNVARKFYINPVVFKSFLLRAKEGMKRAFNNQIDKTASQFESADEAVFKDSIFSIKLEDLDQFDNLDFENTDPENLDIKL